MSTETVGKPVRVVLPTLNLNGSKIQIICNSNDDKAFDIWEKLACLCPDIPQSKQEFLLTKNLIKSCKTKNSNSTM